MKDFTNVLESAIEAAYAGGAVIQSHWGKIDQFESKSSDVDLVTVADKKSEKAVCDYLHKKFPAYGILAEEGGMIKEHEAEEYLWVLDPLDGTTNFTHQFPFVAVSLGLLYLSEPILGVVYNPILHELFCAIKGQGATLNGKKISVSRVDTLDKSLLATGFPYNRRETNENNYKEFNHLTQLSQGVRRAGAAALDLAYVAAGRLDGYWELGLKPWDMAAGVVLVREAGGKVSSYDNGPLDISSGRAVATNAHLHPALIDALKTCRT